MKKILTFLTIASLVFSAAPMSAYAKTLPLGTVFEDNFESYSENDGKSALENNGWSVSIGSGDTVTVATDPKTNSKALKFVIQNGGTAVKAHSTSLQKGKIKVTFDFRAQNHSRRVEQVGMIIDSENKNFGMHTAFGNFYSYVTGAILGVNYIGVLDLSDRDCTHFEIVYDTATKEGTISKDNGTPTTRVGYAENLSDVVFRFVKATNGWNGSDNDGTDTNAGVYWVDNLKVENLSAFGVTETDPKNESKDIAVDKTASVTFNKELDFSTVKTDNISVFENDTQIEADKYSVSQGSDSKTVNIALKDKFNYDKAYKIVVKKAVLSSETGATAPTEDYSFTFTTKSIINGFFNVKENGEYQEGCSIESTNSSSDVTYKAYLAFGENSEEEYTFGTPISKAGSYKVRIVATDSANSKTEEKTYAFTVFAKVAPEAQNVKITQTDNTLTATYDFFDKNGDKKAGENYKWQRYNSETKEYDDIENAASQTYTMTEKDENSYIRVGVQPISENDPKEGEWAYSEKFTCAFAPTATNPKIVGTDISVGSTLKAEFSYYDENGDKPGTHGYQWYRSLTKTATPEPISGANSETYVITESDINHYLSCEITPKNDVIPKEGTTVATPLFTGPFKPEAKNVTISGTARVGQTLGVSFDYYDENGDKEGSHKYKWYQNGSVISTASYLTIESNMTGSIYVEVTPVSTASPYDGEAVNSGVLTISSSVSGSGSSYTPSYTVGGGSSSGSGSSGGSTSGGNGSQTTTPTTPSTPAQQSAFADITGHWAQKQITELYEKKIINGINDSTFAPDNNITRAEIATIIAKALNLKGDNADFDDVKNDMWFYESVSAVKNEGIMSGDGTSFRPNEKITREEVAKMLANIAKNKNLEPKSETTVKYTDEGEMSDWATESIYYVSSLGLLNGKAQGVFAPKSYATRAEIAVLIVRLLGQLN